MCALGERERTSDAVAGVLVLFHLIRIRRWFLDLLRGDERRLTRAQLVTRGLLLRAGLLDLRDRGLLADAVGVRLHLHFGFQRGQLLHYRAFVVGHAPTMASSPGMSLRGMVLVLALIGCGG